MIVNINNHNHEMQTCAEFDAVCECTKEHFQKFTLSPLSNFDWNQSNKLGKIINTSPQAHEQWDLEINEMTSRKLQTPCIPFLLVILKDSVKEIHKHMISGREVRLI